MKKLSPKISLSRRLLSGFSLFGISLFFIFTPVLGRLPGPATPVVKSAFSTEPLTPVSAQIPAPTLTANGIFIMDFDTGIVLLGKNPHLHLRPASLTKIMTSLIALDNYSEDSVLTVKSGPEVVGSSVNLVRGDKLSADDLLYSMLVPSGNDAAVTLAENFPGGYQAFLQKMNQKVSDLGLVNTHFTNVSGVESPDHYTSAFDIAMIARSALLRPFFANVVSTKNITVTSLLGHNYSLVSTNIMLGRPGIMGVKTGWTPEAGECLVILATKNNHRVLISLLDSKDRFGEGQQLVDWVFKNFTWQ